ncbi:hypothetical protein ACSMFR_00315 [Listeria aquatica]|uniref:hypothetical protein n=1 Tax=Listeria aquatica TaxID=1494960 RepID=UPI003F6F69A7
MSGFFGFISRNQKELDKKIELQKVIQEKSKHLFSDKEQLIEAEGLFGKIFSHTHKKFQNDKVFGEDDEGFWVLDGVIVNKKNLMEQYNINAQADMLSIIRSINRDCKKENLPFFNKFRGSFAGCFVDFDRSNFTIFTNHIGDKEIFIYFSATTQTLYFGTDFRVLVKFIHQHTEMTFEINENATYSLLTHGHTLCRETLFNEIKRLAPGHYLEFTSDGSLEEKPFYLIKNAPVPISEQEAIKKIDQYFRQAVKRAFDKDVEYGYRHLVALSGGLDSRMTTWVAHDLGYKDILNYTFSQTDYWDQTVPKEITQVLQHEWMFQALDNGLYLSRQSKKAVQLTGGRGQNAGVTHTLNMLNNINFNKFGLVHTGQLGDVILGTYYNSSKARKFSPGDGAVSQKLIKRVKYSSQVAVQVEDQELFKFYNRGLTGVNIGLKPMHQYTETLSPFLDVDFLSFCFSLPLEYRYGHRIYIKWIKKCYPQAADFVYEKVGGKINGRIMTIKGTPVPLIRVPSMIIKYLRKKTGRLHKTKQHMNPLDYWYENNNELKEFYNDQLRININRVKNEELREACEFVFRKGATIEKDQVVTFLLFLQDMGTYVK